MKWRLWIGLIALAVVATVWFAGTMLAEKSDVTICHLPPGNPANAQTITVSQNAVPAHLAHGDHLGACPASPDR